MSTDSQDTTQKIVKLVQELLIDEKGKAEITPGLIESKITLVAALNPRWSTEVDRVAVTDELIRRFSIWIGQDTKLTSNVGHVAWLAADRKRDWRYWQRYREWLERKLSYSAVEGLDRTTDTILSLLEDPLRDGSWDRRGLVVGHVQSGKTANYTGLICKAADAGYKIIIVLAGMHNNLRSQTQIRLDEGFLGYETKGTPDDEFRLIGVGEIDADQSIRPNHVTNRSEKGDFVTAAARNLGITPEQRPWLFVVKKNKTVLERLYGWIRNHVADHEDPQTGLKLVTKLPLLVIDDESDHASVDTGEQIFNAEGVPDEEHEPTAINRRIRKILHSFARAAYVGYTATPFANIFIHDRGETRDVGPDLFPSSFIVNLAAPSNYIGPRQVFGAMSQDGRVDGLPLVRPIEDQGSDDNQSVWMPTKHKNGHVPLHNGTDGLPPSLVEAIDAFVLGCAIRRVRGQGNEHSSMLVHVTRFTSVQGHIRRQIDAHVLHMRQRLTRRIDHEAITARLHALWSADFSDTTNQVLSALPEAAKPLPDWAVIETQLADAVEDIVVRSINGTAKDALDYLDHAGKGLKVIAVGGDKLARGLTLDGLTVSYFLRASRMYDTLMQMGRWFGYRPGYLDLCRLYTTADLIDWFGHIADAAEELREEFDIMAESGATPKEYGLRVQSHPVLLVTSRLKMRATKDLWLSFSGDVLETVALHRDVRSLEGNLKALDTLVNALGVPSEVDPVRIRQGNPQNFRGFLWSKVDAAEIINFLLAYRTHPDAHKVRSELLVEFIQSMNRKKELTNWTVVVVSSGDKGSTFRLNEHVSVDMQQRSNKTPESATKYSIGRLLSPKDETVDLDEKAWEAALQSTRAAWKPDPAKAKAGQRQEPPDVPSGPHIRKIRGLGAVGVPAAPERGLLLIYLLDPKKSGEAVPAETPIVAFGISFPLSEASSRVKYTVNSVQWKQWESDYGAAD